MIFLGDAVWEGHPGAASRVLLPMQLAFNILVPAGRAWWLVLVLGNLTLLAAPATLESPTGEGYVIKGRDELVYGRAGQKVTIDFSDTWYPVERHNNDTGAGPQARPCSHCTTRTRHPCESGCASRSM